MLTPAITASRTSAPAVIMVKAFCTAVTSPPFLKRLPLAEETTTGFTGGGTNIKGAALLFVLPAAMVRPAAALVIIKSRRLILLPMNILGVWSLLPDSRNEYPKK